MQVVLLGSNKKINLAMYPSIFTMPNDSLQINTAGKGITEHSYDAIVIGSGISGGWAAKELCELGLKTLVLERGRNVEHNRDYPTATMKPWEFRHRGQMTKEFLQENPL